MVDALLIESPPPPPPPPATLQITMDWDDALLLGMAAWNDGANAPWLDQIDDGEGLWYALPLDLRQAVLKDPRRFNAKTENKEAE